VASVLRLSVPVASQVAEAFSLSAAACSLMPTRVGKLLHAAAVVSVPEIIHGLTTITRCRIKFMLRPAEVTEGFTEATMVVAVVTVAMVAIVAATFVPAVVLVIERITHGASDETSDGTSEGSSDDTSDETSESSGHSTFSIVARGARAGVMPTPGCLLTGRLRQKQIRPSVICRTPDPSQLGRMLGCGTHAEAMECRLPNGTARHRSCDCV